MEIFFIMDTGEKVGFFDLTGLPSPDVKTRERALVHIEAAMAVDDRIADYEISDSQLKKQIHYSGGNCNCHYTGKCG